MAQKKDSLEERLLGVAAKTKAQISVEHDREGWFKIINIKNDGMDIYVWLKKYRNEYLPVGLEGDGLPRELYGEPFEEKAKALKRGEEIIANATRLLSRSITFHLAPSIFNKQRGHIVLSIDGKNVKIMQRRNIFNLPPAQTSGI